VAAAPETVKEAGHPMSDAVQGSGGAAAGSGAAVRSWIDHGTEIVEGHLAVVSRRLTTVATIFLPISFLAGFWGENFNVLTDTIEKGWAAFLILSVGLTVACILITTFILSRRRWT
jgi:hypothetical protein